MSNVRNTPQAIGTSGGTDNQGAQQDNTAQQFPQSVDAISNMQYPDQPGGPDGNAPISPYHQVHPTTVHTVHDPGHGAYLGMPQYGTQLNQGTTYQPQSQE